MRRHSDANLHLLQRLLVAHDDARINRWGRIVQPVLPWLQRMELLAHQLHKLLFIQIAGRGNDQIGRVDVPRIVVVQ